MSIIERVAELLGSDPKTLEKPSATGKHVRIPAVDLIERIISESSERDEFQPVREAATHPEAAERVADSAAKTSPAGPPSAPARLVRIDLDHLRKQNMITPDSERTSIAESFRRIKRRILLNVSDPKSNPRPNLVMVTSSVVGEGKTFCSINLALSIAHERDRSVLLVDGDVARQSMPRTLGFEAGKGWMNLLLDRGMHLSDVLCKTNIDRLTLLPAGPAHPDATELLASGAMGMLLQGLSARDPNRIIIFDSPPLLAASEAAALASQVGQIVVVVEAGKTTEAMLKSALDRLEANVAGLILNKGEGQGLLDGYGGDYGYGAT